METLETPTYPSISTLGMFRWFQWTIGLIWKNHDNSRPMAPMAEFRNTLLPCGLVDMGFCGYPYIWRNDRQGRAFVEERLDRVVATTEWREIFPRTKVSHLSVSYSSHDPIMMDMAPPTQPQKRRHKIQWFEKKWPAHSDCETIIRESWNQIQSHGSPMYYLFHPKKKKNAEWIS